MPKLIVLEGPQRGRIFFFEDDAGIGRASTNVVRLTGTQVSRNHAQIFRRDDTFVVRDLESRNGVLVNGKAAREAALTPGDEIRIGITRMVFEPDFNLQTIEEGGREAVILTEDSAATGVIASAFDAGEAGLAPVADPAELDLERLRKAHDMLRVLYEIGQLVSSVLDIDTVLNRLLDAVLDTLEADRGAVMLRGDGPGEYFPGALRIKEGEEANITVSRTVLHRVVRHGKAVLSSDALDDPRFVSSESIQLGQVRSVLCAPLIVRDKTLGALYVDKIKPYKTFDEEDLRLLSSIALHAAAAVENARVYSLIRDENVSLKQIVREKGGVIFVSEEMGRVVEAVKKIASTNSTVLIRGETGTGKEVVARLIHEQSRRAHKPMICLNCAAVPEGILESELFGHEKGAFTGAHRRKLGTFEAAHGGTLFLDEIGEMSAAVQTKLLRVLEERRLTRVGGVESIAVDVRIVAASNRDLEAEVEKGRFREDLFYRLAVVPLLIPPLRERPADVGVLVTFFLARFNREMGKRVEGFTDDAMAALGAYPWPGNVRELQNMVEQVVVMAESNRIEVGNLPERILDGGRVPSELWLESRSLNLPELIEKTERLCIERALGRAGGKKIDAARLLNVSRPTLDKKIKKYGIDLRK